MCSCGESGMTDYEIIEVLKNERECVLRNIKGCDRDCGKCDLVMNDSVIVNAYDMAIMALQEIQQYRAIGTVEDIKEILRIVSEGQDDVDESGISTGLLHTLLEYAKYTKIGTAEKCREAREKQMPMEPMSNKNIMYCPVCERKVRRNYDLYCSGCGQALNWSELE